MFVRMTVCSNYHEALHIIHIELDIKFQTSKSFIGQNFDVQKYRFQVTKTLKMYIKENSLNT